MFLRLLIAGILLIAMVVSISCFGEKTETQDTAPGLTSGEETSAPEYVSGEAEGAISGDQQVSGEQTRPDPPRTVLPLDTEVSLDPNAVSWTARDIDGKTHKSSEWIGKQPVVINFWGTWCPPCRKEIPDLVRAYEEFKPKGVEIISFALRDTPGQVRNYAEKAGMKWVMLMGEDQKMLADYKFSGGVPTTIFLDKTGKEVGRFVGPRNLEIFRQAFEQTL